MLNYMKRIIIASLLTSFMYIGGYNTATFYTLNTDRSSCDTMVPYVILDTIYGEFIITEPILIELLQSPMMERLKLVRQYGPFYYAIRAVGFTRYDHSIGVLALLIRAGASLQEQVAGLLHDISHPVFSHGGGYVFSKNPLEADAHQDDNHAAFLRASGIEKILTTYGFTIDDIHHKNPLFTALERNLPYLCADRIEYNIHGGLAEHLITQEEAISIVNSLIFENGIWLFTNAEQAKKFARISLWKTENTWGSAENILANILIGDAMRRALEIDVLSIDDVIFGTDEVVWQRLEASTDHVIKEYLQKLHHCTELFELDTQTYDTCIKVKFRGIDPMVKINEQIYQLSQIDQAFKHEYDSLKKRIEQGWHIRYKAIDG